MYERRTTPKATKRLNRLAIAWAAGFIEGEGSFTLCKTSKFGHIVASQVNREPLEKLQSYFGGYIIPIRNRTVNRWGVSGIRAELMARKLYPFLSKKRQAQAVKILKRKLRSGLDFRERMTEKRYPNKKELTDLYSYTAPYSLARKLDISPQVLFRLLREFNIPLRGKRT